MKVYGVKKKASEEAFREGKVTVSVYGLGKMGLPLATLFADRGAKVLGVDISEKVVSDINKGINHITEEPGLSLLVRKNVLAGRLRATTDGVQASKDSDVKVILVPTLIRDHKPDLSPVYAVAEKIAEGLNPGDIVVTECTMPPGSTESLIPVLERSGLKAGKDFGLGHCPERTMTGTALDDISGKYPKIVGGIDEKTTEALTGIYSAINSKGVITCSGIKSAELVKVYEGVYRDVNIALANELEKVCRKLDVDYMEIQKAANTQPYSHLHVPGGVGGHCIPFYPYFVMDKDTVLLRTAREVNDMIPSYLVSLAKEALAEKDVKLSDANVLVLGISFRGGVKETIKSTSLELIELLKKEAAFVHAFDPLYSKEETERYASYKRDFSGIDCVFLMADHKEFRILDWDRIAKEVRTKAVVDSRQFLSPEEMRRKGYSFRGLGFQ